MNRLGNTRISEWQNRSMDLKLLVALSCAFFLVPILENFESVSLAGATYVATGFGLIVALEALVIHAIRLICRRLLLWQGWVAIAVSILIVINFGYFFYVLLGGRWFFILIPASIVVLLVVLSFQSVVVYRATLLFAAVFAALSASKALYAHLSYGEASHRPTSASRPGTSGNRNIYAIVFDALASRKALSTFYGIDKPSHAAVLESMGFDVYDKISADEATRSSIGRMLSFGKHITSRTRFPFDGLGRVPLYESLRSRGYKIQFIDVSDALEGNAGGIDYFAPTESRAPSVCRFVDKRYGIFLCRPWFLELMRLQTDDGWIPDNESDFKKILKRFSYAANDRSSSWFSFGYFYFPGHTDTAYRYRDEVARVSYVQKMNADVLLLGDYFRRVFESVTTHDPHAVILIFGDHGNWLTRGLDPTGSVDPSSGMSRQDILLDRRGTMLGVYPKSFCKKEVEEIEDLGVLFKAVLTCLNTSEALDDRPGLAHVPAENESVAVAFRTQIESSIACRSAT
jgi:hypothetical protein